MQIPVPRQQRLSRCLHQQQLVTTADPHAGSAITVVSSVRVFEHVAESHDSDSRVRERRSAFADIFISCSLSLEVASNEISGRCIRDTCDEKGRS